MVCKLMLTAERLREVLSYDPETGLFTWLAPTSNRIAAGKRAGHVNASDGYVRIELDHTLHGAHRLAWLYVTGEWPACLIDHRDMNRANNRWSNLRAATKSQNAANARAWAKPNPDRPRGAYFDKRDGRWFSAIKHNGKTYRLGRFATSEEAAAAYSARAAELFGEYARAD
jgi:hypothetical protein